MIELTEEQNVLYEKCVAHERGDDRGEDCQMVMGILGEGHGRGKTYVMLALLCYQNESSVRFTDIKYMSLGCNKVLLSLHERNFEDVCLDVVVFPYHLLRKWVDACKEMMGGGGKYRVLCLSRHIMETLGDIKELNVDVLLVVNTIYDEFSRELKKRNLRIRRVVYDEADSLKSVTEEIPCRFTWYMSGSYQNLLYPYGKVTWDRDMEIVISNCTGILHNGCIKRAFLSLADNMSPEFVGKMVMRTDVGRTSRRCERFIECVSYKTEFMETKIGSDVRDREIQYFIRRDMVEKATSLLDYRMKSGIEEFVGNERVMSCEDCLICHDNIRYKTVLRCCGNSYCFSCIFRWLSVCASGNEKNDCRCPMCNQVVTRGNMSLIVGGDELGRVNSEKRSMNHYMRLSEGLFEENNFAGRGESKIENVVNIVRSIMSSNESARIVVYYPVDYIYVNIVDRLNVEGIGHCLMKGNGNKVLYTLRQFEKGVNKVLLVGPSTYRCGIDITFATDVVMIQRSHNDVEEKIIGRVDRFGRDGVFNCWYVLNRQEAVSYVKRVNRIE